MRTGTERSVSWVRSLISAKIRSRRLLEVSGARLWCRRSRPRGRRWCPATPCRAATRSRRRTVSPWWVRFVRLAARDRRRARSASAMAETSRHRAWGDDTCGESSLCMSADARGPQRRPRRGGHRRRRPAAAGDVCERRMRVPCGQRTRSMRVGAATAAASAGVRVGAQVSYDDREGFGRRPHGRAGRRARPSRWPSRSAVLDEHRRRGRHPGDLPEAARRALQPGRRRRRAGAGGARRLRGAAGPRAARRADPRARRGRRPRRTFLEGFPDRATGRDRTDGVRLVPRDRPGAVLEDPDEIAARAVAPRAATSTRCACTATDPRPSRRRGRSAPRSRRPASASRPSREGAAGPVRHAPGRRGRARPPRRPACTPRACERGSSVDDLVPAARTRPLRRGRRPRRRWRLPGGVVGAGRGGRRDRAGSSRCRRRTTARTSTTSPALWDMTAPRWWSTHTATELRRRVLRLRARVRLLHRPAGRTCTCRGSTGRGPGSRRGRSDWPGSSPGSTRGVPRRLAAARHHRPRPSGTRRRQPPATLRARDPGAVHGGAG